MNYYLQFNNLNGESLETQPEYRCDNKDSCSSDMEGALGGVPENECCDSVQGPGTELSTSESSESEQHISTLKNQNGNQRHHLLPCIRLDVIFESPDEEQVDDVISSNSDDESNLDVSNESDSCDVMGHLEFLDGISFELPSVSDITE